MTKNLFDNPFYIVLLFFVVTFFNIIFTVHFIPLMLAGVVFTAFIYVYERENYYSLALTILSFIMIEISQGMPFLSLSLLSFLIYMFLIPKIKQIFSLGELDFLLFMIIFYSSYLLLYFLLEGVNLSVLFKIVLNVLVDLILVGILF